MTHRAESRRRLKVSSLAYVRSVAEKFAGCQLPEWEEVAGTSIVSTHDARERIDQDGHVSLILRGQAKLITRDLRNSETVQQFVGQGDLVAPRVRPSWASDSGPPLSTSRWYLRDWSIPELELHSLTSCAVLHLDATLIEKLADKHPSWARVQAAFLWTYIDTMWAVLLDSRVKASESRYRDLMNRPSPPTAATQAEMASFLGITRQSLNRTLSTLPQPGEADEPECDVRESPLPTGV